MGNAVTTVSQLGIAEAVNLARDVGGWINNIAGDIPKDLVGLVAGDRLKAYRMEKAAEVVHCARERLKAKGITPLDNPSPSIILPILESAMDEGREELKRLWEGLLATALDPDKTTQVARLFIDLVKAMDPLDARILVEARNHPNQQPNMRDALASRMTVGPDAIEVSMLHLIELGLAVDQHLGGTGLSSTANIALVTKGRELLRLVGL
jgi:hypothetical protein